MTTASLAVVDRFDMRPAALATGVANDTAVAVGNAVSVATGNDDMGVVAGDVGCKKNPRKHYKYT